MDTQPTSRSSRSWGEITTRARSESPPEIDIHLAVRRRIESGLAIKRAEVSRVGTLEGIAEWLTGYRVFAASCAAVAALTLLGWQSVPVIRDVAIVLQLENALLAGF